MSISGLGELATLAKTILDKAIPDPIARAEASLRLVEAEQKGDLEELRIAISVILEEAKSADPWTSRARPSFLYVMYIMILSAIPIGVLFAFNPEAIKTMMEGMKLWFEALPQELYALFGIGYLGYGKWRSDDKAVAMGAKTKRLGIF